MTNPDNYRQQIQTYLYITFNFYTIFSFYQNIMKIYLYYFSRIILYTTICVTKLLQILYLVYTKPEHL